jgi:hypothetical protein
LLREVLFHLTRLVVFPNALHLTVFNWETFLLFMSDLGLYDHWEFSDRCHHLSIDLRYLLEFFEVLNLKNPNQYLWNRASLIWAIIWPLRVSRYLDLCYPFQYLWRRTSLIWAIIRPLRVSRCLNLCYPSEFFEGPISKISIQYLWFSLKRVLCFLVSNFRIVAFVLKLPCLGDVIFLCCAQVKKITQIKKSGRGVPNLCSLFRKCFSLVLRAFGLWFWKDLSTSFFM